MTNVKANLSRGEEIIRTTFAANDAVANLKNKYAELYNEVTGLVTWRNVTDKDEEEQRCIKKALELLELSAMMAVKGLTTRL